MYYYACHYRTAGAVGGRMDADSLKASGMLNMLTSAEGREKLQGLAAKVGFTAVFYVIPQLLCSSNVGRACDHY